MSLKGFHILLISLSALLSLLFAGWSLHAWRATGEGSNLFFAVFSAVLAAGLAVYVVWFARKMRSRADDDRERRKLIRPLALGAAAWLAAVKPAGACAVCFGQAQGPMIDAARLGVWLLFGLVFAIQAAFVVFFLYLRRRAREYRARHPHANWESSS